MQTLTSRLRIFVDDRHVIESTDGQTLWLRTTDGTPLDPDSDWNTSNEIQVYTLAGVAGILDSMGLTVEHPVFVEYVRIARRQFGILADVAKTNPARPLIATFGNGHFKAQWHPPTATKTGHWTFAQPNDPRLDLGETGYHIESTDDLVTTGIDALDRTLLIAGTELEYGELGDIMADLARLLTNDPHLIRVEVQS